MDILSSWAVTLFIFHSPKKMSGRKKQWIRDQRAHHNWRIQPYDLHIQMMIDIWPKIFWKQWSCNHCWISFLLLNKYREPEKKKEKKSPENDLSHQKILFGKCVEKLVFFFFLKPSSLSSATFHLIQKKIIIFFEANNNFEWWTNLNDVWLLTREIERSI